jgi:hypothetical protein
MPYDGKQSDSHSTDTRRMVCCYFPQPPKLKGPRIFFSSGGFELNLFSITGLETRLFQGEIGNFHHINKLRLPNRSCQPYPYLQRQEGRLKENDRNKGTHSNSD